MENMSIEQLLQEQANVVQEMLDSKRNFTNEMVDNLTIILNTLMEKYKEKMDSYITKATNEIKAINPAILGRKDYDNEQKYFIANRHIPGRNSDDYTKSEYIEPPRYLGNKKTQDQPDRFIKEEDLDKYKGLVEKYNAIFKLRHDILQPFRNNPKNSNAATLNYELRKMKEQLESMGISATRVESIITEEEKQKNIDEYVFARNALEILYKEASLYNRDQKTFNETREQLKKEIAEIESKLSAKGLLEKAKEAYIKDFENRRKRIIDQYKNKNASPEQLNLEEEIRKLQSDIVKQENTMKSYITNGYLQERINLVSNRILAEVKRFKHYSDSNPDNEELKDKYETIKYANNIATKIQEMIKKKQPITDIFKNIVALHNAMEVAKQKEILNENALNLISALNDLGKQYEKNVEKLGKLTDLKNRQESSETIKKPTIIPLPPAQDQSRTQTQNPPVIPLTPVQDQSRTQTQNPPVIPSTPVQDQSRTQTTTTKPESQAELPKEFRVEKRSAWQWAKDNKKKILIIAGLSAIGVAVVAGLQQLWPAIMEYLNARDISNTCNEMVENADKWHELAETPHQANLHIRNEVLATTLEKNNNIKSVFENGSGIWKLGELGEELHIFDKKAKKNVLEAMKKITFISKTAGTLALGGLGSIGFGSILNAHSSTYEKYKEEIKKYTKQEKYNNLDNNFYIVIIELAQKISKDETLTDSEKRNLLRKITKLYDKTKENNQENERNGHSR